MTRLRVEPLIAQSWNGLLHIQFRRLRVKIQSNNLSHCKNLFAREQECAGNVPPYCVDAYSFNSWRGALMRPYTFTVVGRGTLLA